MSYYANGNGTIKFKQKVDVSALNDFLERDDIDFKYYFEDTAYEHEDNQLIVSTYENYHEPNKVLDQLAENFPVIDGSSIEYRGEDDSHWRFKYQEKEHCWIEENGEVVYDTNHSLEPTRIIDLYYDDEDCIVETNVPAEIIKAAIQYKNDIRYNDDNDGDSDFEIIQNYIWDQNQYYIFNEIGYVDDLESYYW